MNTREIVVKQINYLRDRDFDGALECDKEFYDYCFQEYRNVLSLKERLNKHKNNSDKRYQALIGKANLVIAIRKTELEWLGAEEEMIKLFQRLHQLTLEGREEKNREKGLIEGTIAEVSDRMRTLKSKLKIYDQFRRELLNAQSETTDGGNN